MKRHLIAILLGTIALAPSAEANNRLPSGAHWRKAALAPYLYVADCMQNPRWDAAIRRAIGEWNRSPAIEFRLVACTSRAARFPIRDGNYGRDGRAASFRYRYDGGRHFTQASLKLNSYYGDRYTAANRQGSACHELGHALGLDHRPRGSESCLAPGNPFRPDAHDMRKVAQIYAHG